MNSGILCGEAKGRGAISLGGQLKELPSHSMCNQRITQSHRWGAFVMVDVP